MAADPHGFAAPWNPLSEAARQTLVPWLARTGAALGEGCPSEYSFTNLLLFNDVHRYEWRAGPWPAIAGVTYDGARHVMPLFDLSAVPAESLAALLRGRDVLYPLAESQVEQLPLGRFEVRAERADADYLYSARTLLHFPGRMLQNKRRQVHQLLADHRVTTVAYGRAEEAAACAVLAGWTRDKGKAAGDADEPACRAALADAERLGLAGQLHHVDGEPGGFVLAERLHAGVWAVRFAKARMHFPGLYPHMFQQLCRSLGSDLRFLNFEQDLGHPGFRQSKLSYGPARLIDKHRARLVEPAAFVAAGDHFAQDAASRSA